MVSFYGTWPIAVSRETFFVGEVVQNFVVPCWKREAQSRFTPGSHLSRGLSFQLNLGF